MPKPKKRKVEPVQTKESKEEEAARLMPPPPPPPPREPVPPSAPAPASPGKQAITEAKVEAAFWKKGVRRTQQWLTQAAEKNEKAGRMFDGQMVRLRRELDRASGIAAWTVDQKMHKAEIGLREARLALETATVQCLTAQLAHQEALVAQRDVTIAHLRRRIRRHRETQSTPPLAP
jgi:hypothetical protein